MKIMKKKIILLFSLLSLLFAPACDEYLDVMPDSRTEIDTDEKIANLLVSAYPSNSFVYATEMSSDNTDWKESTLTSENTVQEQLFAWEDVRDNAGSDSPEDFWVSSYNAISAANHVLKIIEGLGNPERLDAQRGEALMVRAYNHFYLVNVFGKHYSEITGETDLGVPYVEEPETTVNPPYERESVAEVYRRVERDMLEGLPLIDDNAYAVTKYHFNRKAAYAFAARFYLFCRQYDKVIHYSNLVLGDNPVEMLRDMKQFTTLTSDFQLRAKHYVKMEHNTNLLIASLYGNIYTFGNYSTGKKYLHSKRISADETVQSEGPWGIYSGSLYYLSPSSYTHYVATPKIPYYFEYTNPIARTGYRHSIYVVFSADEILLCRAEAYIMKEDYSNALKDLNLWVTNRITTGAILTRATINNFYTELMFYSPQGATVKKPLNPEFAITEEQGNFLQCLLHIRRIETIHDGLRWFDVKRFGIKIYRRRLNANDNVDVVLDSLTVDDPRRAIQIPASVIEAGLTPNPRNK
jgi:hypothetical protein